MGGIGSDSIATESSNLKPLTEIDQYAEEWEYVSFLEDAELENRAIFHLDFDRDNGVWIAASDGLYYYDGYLWKRYSSENGLPSDFVRCVCVTKNGSVWVGTDNGAGTFDGKTFATHGSETGLAGPSVRRIVEDPDGSLWFCCDRYPEYDVPSGLSCYKNGRWTLYNQANGFPGDYPMDYYHGSNGQQYVLTGDRGLLQKVDNQWTFPLETFNLAGNEQLCSIAETPSGTVIISSYGGAYFLENGQWRFDRVFPFDKPYELCRTHDGNIFSFGPVRSKRFNNLEMGLMCWNGKCFDPIPAPIYPEDQWVSFIKEAPDGSIWCGGKGFLLRWTKGNREWNVFKDFPPPKCIDNQGNIWFTGEDAFIRLTPKGWEPWVHTTGLYRQDPNGGVWNWNPRALTYWSKDEIRRYDYPSMISENVDRMLVDACENVWFSTISENREHHFFLFSDGKWSPVEYPELKNQRLTDWTTDPKEGFWAVLTTDHESVYRLVKYATKGKAEEIIAKLSFSGSPNIFIDSSGTIWLFDTNNLYSRNPSSETEWKHVTETIGGIIFTVIETANALWFVCDAGTYGQSGFSRLSNGRWDHFTDRIFNHKTMMDGSAVFIGRKGAYIFKSNDDIDPNRITLPYTGFITGTVYEPNNVLWIRYENDVYRFQADKIPPETLLSAEQNSVYQGDRIAIDFDAVESFVPHSVEKCYRYSWRIDTETWQPFSARSHISIETEQFSTGNHTLEVRAIDEGLDVDPTPASWTFAVLPTPLQNRWWFRGAAAVISSIIVILTLIAVALAFIAVKSRNQARQERSALQWISQKLTGPLSIREIALSVANESRRIFQHDVFSLDVIDTSNERFQNVYREKTPSDSSTPVETTASIEETLPNPTESFNRILAGESLLIERNERVKSQPPSTRENGSHQSRSMLFAPMIWQNQTIGIISVQSYTSGRYQDHDLDILRSFADNCSGALARVRAEEALEKSQAQLFQSQKMEAVGRLAGGIAHDFNNLLVAILGYSEIALNEIAPNSPLRQKIGEIVKAGNRAKSLTQQLLAYSRKQIVQPEVLDLNVVITDMFAMLQRLLGEDIEIELDLQPSLGSVKTDRGQIEQVIVNLSVNARDAMPQGGTLIIQTRNIDFQTSAECEKINVVRGPYVSIRIQDSGFGIDESILQKIFEPFFSTKDKDKGTGLGLSTVYGIIRQNGGGISVTSTPGKETTFHVYLPRIDAAPSYKPIEHTIPLTLQGNETVLLAEDQDQVRILVSCVLRDYGYTVLEARSGAEALTLQAGYNNPIHILLTDVIMPGMSGIELSQSIASQRPEIQTVYISGYTDDILGAHGVLEPDKILLQKPFSNQDLLLTIRRVLNSSSQS